MAGDATLVSEGPGVDLMNLGICEGRLMMNRGSALVELGEGGFHHVLGIVDARRNVIRLYWDGELVDESIPSVFNVFKHRLLLGAHPAREGGPLPWPREFLSGMLVDITV